MICRPTNQTSPKPMTGSTRKPAGRTCLDLTFQVRCFSIELNRQLFIVTNTMASLRPHTAAKLLRTSLPSRQGLALAQQRRFKTDNSKTALTEHGEVHPATKPINAPDYGVHIDKATSYVPLYTLHIYG